MSSGSGAGSGAGAGTELGASEVDKVGASTMLAFAIKFGKEPFDVSVPDTATFAELKAAIAAATDVLAPRQKLLGLPKKDKSGKPVCDDTLLNTLKLKKPQKIMLMGTREAKVHVAPDAKELELLSPDNDLDVPDETELDVAERKMYLDKIASRVEKYEPKVFHEFEPGKKMLVLDIDYTLFDHKSVVEHPFEQARPYVHDFLAAVYPYYNIVIWSATSMKWIELKMDETLCSKDDRFKLSMYMDHYAMITVKHEKYGVFNTKPLGVLWGQYPEFASPKNTIMFDDCGRNFVMNLQSGLKIKPCRNLPMTRESDTELLSLTEYLLAIKDLDDFTVLEHRKWKQYVRRHRRRIDPEAS